MINFLKALFKRYGDDDITGRAAALSYFTIFSIGPLLFVILGIVGVFLGNETYKVKLVSEVTEALGSQAGSLVNTLSNQNLAGKTTIAFVIGGVGLVLSAIGIFGQLQKSFAAIMRIKAELPGGPKKYIKTKLLALGLVALLSLLLIASLVASTLISAVAAGILFTLADFALSVLVLCLVFALLYRTLIDIKIAWKPLFTTSLVVAILFTVGKILLGIVIGNNAGVSAFGAAGSLIALLLWIFYLGQIIYLGVSGLSLYLENHPTAVKPKYPGSTFKVEIIKRPLGNQLTENVLKKFKDGVSKGLKQKK